MGVMTTGYISAPPHDLLSAATQADFTWPPGVYWRIIQGATTAELEQGKTDSGTFEDLGTTPRYVTESIQDGPSLKVIKFASSAQRMPNERQLGAGLINERSIIVQQWEGMVISRETDSFVVRLLEGYRDFPSKVTELSMEEVSEEERELVQAGAPFSWTIGYRIRGGSRYRYSEVYFRRLPAWTKEELTDAEKTATELGKDSGWFEH